MAEKTLTTRAVAKMLGVSEATIKRWAGDRILEAEKTAGGHRRFRVEEVARFQRAQGLGRRARPVEALRAKLSVEKPATFSADSVFEAMVEGQEAEVSALLINAYLHGATLETIFDELLCEAMRRVGDLWSKGELTIAQEHLATRKSVSALNLLRQVVASAEPKSLDAICCCVEEDFHELPSHMAQILFESEGWDVINLSSSTPFFVLSEAVARHKPEAVCVSSTILFNIDRAEHEYKDFLRLVGRLGARVVLGGEGFTEDERVRRRFPADLHASSFKELAGFIRGFRHAPVAG